MLSTIFQVWSKEGFIELQHNLADLKLNSPANESQHTVRLLYNPINLGSNFEGSMDVDAKIPLFLHTAENPTINPHFCIQIRPSKMNHFTLFWVEFH
eukprot:g11514.t1